MAKKNKKTDLEILQILLPNTYTFTETANGVNCTSNVGLTDYDWDNTLEQIKKAFGNRFVEVFHQVNTNHKQFTVYLKAVGDSLKKRFTNLIIIDASGSMSSKIEEVKGGLRQLFKDIKEDAKKNPEVESTTIVVDFSSARDYREIINSTNPDHLTDAVANSYTTRGMTALYDAIGFAFAKVPKDQDGVFVNILTDGGENDSKELKSDDVKRLIEEGKSKRWAITFMGTTEDCLNHAVSLGISVGNTMQFTNSGAGVSASLRTAKLSREAYYTTFASPGVSTTEFDLSNIVSSVLEKEEEVLK